MRKMLTGLGLVLAAGLLATGCVVHEVDGGHHGGGPVLDAPRALGAQQMIGYRVSAGAASELPAGDIGYVMTANGQGGYRLTWSDTLGSAAVFSGSITTDGVFDANQLQGFSGAEDITLSADQGTITFSSAPGANLDGVDLVSSTDPIYVDMKVDGSRGGFGIYFTGAESGALLTSDYDPVAFTSP